jgi:hypothetical protein
LVDETPHLSAETTAVSLLLVATAFSLYFDDKGGFWSAKAWLRETQAMFEALRPMMPTFIIESGLREYAASDI